MLTGSLALLLLPCLCSPVLPSVLAQLAYYLRKELKNAKEVSLVASLDSQVVVVRLVRCSRLRAVNVATWSHCVFTIACLVWLCCALLCRTPARPRPRRRRLLTPLPRTTRTEASSSTTERVRELADERVRAGRVLTERACGLRPRQPALDGAELCSVGVCLCAEVVVLGSASQVRIEQLEKELKELSTLAMGETEVCEAGSSCLHLHVSSLMPCFAPLVLSSLQYAKWKFHSPTVVDLFRQFPLTAKVRFSYPSQAHSLTGSWTDLILFRHRLCLPTS